MYRSKQDEAKDDNILRVCTDDPVAAATSPEESNEVATSVSSREYQCVSDEHEMIVYDNQRPYMYATQDYMQLTDQVVFRVSPCVASASRDCEDAELVEEKFANADLRLSLR